ncbi:zinc finger protein RFP-like isoform X1 [Alligator sinensis]|uniref:Zinc finger protein RFP-like isoform X1 n=2 Tax=Alligator sinensis TaxID=38654 RepID=A0A1U8D814_ALLSI|nr:zinc finger protein RFP-like isoform X1 [Alligator sinensis]XP_014373824.1 zinc finger protein RFP-like isoform X1 [Alligator sinensis]
MSRRDDEKFQQPVEMSPDLEMRPRDFSHKSVDLTESLRKFRDKLPSNLGKGRQEPQGSFAKVTMTLDPDTANPNLILSADRRSMRWGDAQQDLPDNPERFDTCPCLLGCKEITSGRHYWEVEVEEKGNWAVGIATAFVKRKDWIHRNPEGGIWALEKWRNHLKALTIPETHLPLCQFPQRIRVSLDHQGGQVSFFDASNDALIFTFPQTSFTGQRLLPWFWLYGSKSELRICP